MKICIINGSPKASKSTSELLIEYLMSFIKENKVGILRIGTVNYISLTDLAKYQNSSDPSFTVKNWLMGRNLQS